jgi:hypothetical protein
VQDKRSLGGGRVTPAVRLLTIPGGSVATTLHWLIAASARGRRYKYVTGQSILGKAGLQFIRVLFGLLLASYGAMDNQRIRSTLGLLRQSS